MTSGGIDIALPAAVATAEAGPTAQAVFEVLGTARAIRHLLPDPVGEEHVDALVWAATRASSADNNQPWAFVVVTDAEQRQRIAEAVAGFSEFSRDLSAPVDEVSARTRRGAMHLLANLSNVPVLLFVCGRNDYPPVRPQERYLWSALFAASQNIVVAARALGLSAVLTMLHVANPSEVRHILRVPADYKIAAMFAIGWPARRPGPMKRRDPAEVTHRDRW